MKKVLIIIALVAVLFAVENYTSEFFSSIVHRDKVTAEPVTTQDPAPVADFFPEFYRGIYLNVASAKNMDKLKFFVTEAKKAGMNTIVMDCQSSRYQKNVIPKENVQYCIDNGIHPIARIVCFPEGLKTYPIGKEVIDEKYEIAESACLNGFREIQFDYIRFNDSNRLKNLTLANRYAFIEGFLNQARERLKKYNVKIAADVFGRIPLNSSDLIGQRMEGLDNAVDIICPMAYPSHYTWSRQLQDDPYKTVLITSQKAEARTSKANIVTYIQAFKMKLGPNSYEHYIRQQLKAVHDAGIKGFLMWNARQDYTVPLAVTREFYAQKPELLNVKPDKMQNRAKIVAELSRNKSRKEKDKKEGNI
jgi:hypothetical protein